MHGKRCHQHTTYWPNLPIKRKFSYGNRSTDVWNGPV
jgi:hypothetical protein